MRARQFQGLCAVVSKVAPRPLMQLAWKAAQVLADDVLRSVGRARVHDDPIADERTQGIEAAADHLRLVLDDHAEANHLRLHALPGWIAHDFTALSRIFAIVIVRTMRRPPVLGTAGPRLHAHTIASTGSPKRQQKTERLNAGAPASSFKLV